MREITTKVYTFEELEPEVQDKIIDNWDMLDYDWWESVYEDAEQVGIKILAFDIGRRTIEIKNMIPLCMVAEAIIKEHGETCDTYQESKKFLDKITPLQEKLERVEDIDYRRGRRDCLDTLRDSLTDEIEDLLKDFLHDLGEEYLAILRREYEYLNSREAILNTIVSNNYEFTENGDLI